MPLGRKLFPWLDILARDRGYRFITVTFRASDVRASFGAPYEAAIQEKNVVLRAAAIDIHSVTVHHQDILLPSYRIELTIKQRCEAQTSFQFWEPGSLIILDHEASADELENPDEHLAGEVEEVEVFTEGLWESEGMEYQGVQSIRPLVKLDKPRNFIRLGYYFEILPSIYLCPTTELTK